MLVVINILPHMAGKRLGREDGSAESGYRERKEGNEDRRPWRCCNGIRPSCDRPLMAVSPGCRQHSTQKSMDETQARVNGAASQGRGSGHIPGGKVLCGTARSLTSRDFSHLLSRALIPAVPSVSLLNILQAKRSTVENERLTMSILNLKASLSLSTKADWKLLALKRLGSREGSRTSEEQARLRIRASGFASTSQVNLTSTQVFTENSKLNIHAASTSLASTHL